MVRRWLWGFFAGVGVYLALYCFFPVLTMFSDLIPDLIAERLLPEAFKTPGLIPILVDELQATLAKVWAHILLTSWMFSVLWMVLVLVKRPAGPGRASAALPAWLVFFALSVLVAAGVVGIELWYEDAITDVAKNSLIAAGALVSGMSYYIATILMTPASAKPGIPLGYLVRL